MRRAPATLAALVLVLAGAACGHDDTVATGASTTVSGRGEDVVLSLVTGGGFVPFGADFASVPIKVQRDGTVLTGGAVPAIYPGPALVPVMTGTLGGAQLRELLDAAKAAGLADDHLDLSPDPSGPQVADAATTKITVEIDGAVHEHSIYAAGMGDERPGPRQAVSAFVTHASDVVQRTADRPFAPTAYQVLATKEPEDAPAPEVAPNHLTWPVPDVPLAEGPCIDVDAAHAAALTEALAKATQITVWEAGGVSWHLVVRALLPGDAACAAAPG